jgi:hypothetical protein
LLAPRMLASLICSRLLQCRLPATLQTLWSSERYNHLSMFMIGISSLILSQRC